MGQKRSFARRLAIVVVVVAMLAAAILWGRSGRTPPVSNVLVIVLDSLRVDRVGHLGSPAGLTPFLDELAAGATVYERAYAPSSWTVPVVASLFTGQYPSEHRATNFFVGLDSATPTLAEVLAQHGFATSAVGANAALREEAGFARGFERWAVVGKREFLNPKADGTLITEQVLRWVDEVGPERRHFLYLHYMDIHMPYRGHPGGPRPAVQSRRSDMDLNMALVQAQWDFTADEVQRLETLYDGEVRYQDQELRALFTGLEERGFLDDALVIVTADHGEEFGVHGAFGHGASLHEVAVRVPLLVHRPGVRPGRVRQPVQLLGVTASVLDAAQVARPPSVRFPPLPAAGSQPAPTVYSELVECGQGPENWLHKQALIAGDHKLLVRVDGTRVVYDLTIDPGEHRPAPARDGGLSAALDEQLARIEPGTAAAQSVPDAAVLERLRALGYAPD